MLLQDGSDLYFSHKRDFPKIGIFIFPPEKAYFSADTGPKNLIFCVNIPQGILKTLLGPESVFSAVLSLNQVSRKT
jgi:hypothetical protein